LWRLEFACGYRALATARGEFAALGQAASLLSCGLPDVPAVLAKTIEEKRALHSAVKRLEERLAEQESRALLSAASAEKGSVRVIAHALDDATADYSRLLAAKMVAEADVVALLASRAGGQLVFAQSKGLPHDMGAVLREALKEFRGKGGGAKNVAQGSVPDAAQIDAVLARAKDLLRK
jgi:alanyl-tRNA synthetase